MALSFKSVPAGISSEPSLKLTDSQRLVARLFSTRHAAIDSKNTLQNHQARSQASAPPKPDRRQIFQRFLQKVSLNSPQPEIQPARTVDGRSRSLKPFQKLNGQLNDRDRLNQQRPGTYADNYSLSGFSVGQQVRIDLKSNQFDGFLQVVNAKGQVLWQNDDRTYDTANASVTFTIQPEVIYQVRVTTADIAQVGRYTLSSLEPSTTPLFNSDYGYGLVDAAKAVAAAIGQSPFADVPNLGGTQWDLDTIKAPEVWAQGFTGQGVTVAVLDTGIDYTHVDLQSNIWQNPGEVPDNGIDDDRNGFIDDVHGWNFVDGKNNNPIVQESHGTHVSGTIAAANNSFGTTGVAYNAKILPIKVIDDLDSSSSQRFDENIAQGIRYAVQNGARVINMSLGNYLGDPLMVQTRAALEYATQSGVISVMASGNERDEGANRPIQPAYFARQGLGVAVGAINRRQQVAYFSNPAGKKPLDFLVAPGVNIRSTTPNNSYEQAGWSGTSMATPHISGVVALMLSANPNLTPAQVIAILQASADPYDVSDI